MVDSLSVDPAALADAAARLASLATQIGPSALGGESLTSLLALQGELPATRSGWAAVDLGRAIAQVAAEVVSVVDGLSAGLRVAADAYRHVDLAAGQVAGELGRDAGRDHG